jgi:CheY-like chemotaxis protein
MTKGATHDYNNIFTGLSGQLQLIAQEANFKEIDKNRMQMVNDLLARGSNRTSILYEFSRYNPTEKQDHSVDRILTLAVEALNIVSRTHQFVVEKHKELPRLFCCMKDVVMMLFYLGENALEATPEGGTIFLGAELDSDEDGAIIFSVRDKGRGISQIVRSSLFKPFISTKISGNGPRGLGLFAVRNIAKDHGGTLFFSDDKNEETVFSVRFPLPHQEEGEDKFSLEEVVLPAAPLVKKSGRQRETFFVIEDDEAMRDMIVNSLQRRGHVVFSAETCRDAVEDFELVYEVVTVLLIDVGLTDTEGFDCLELLLPISNKAKVIFMSGEDIGKQEYLKYNAMFLKKPFITKDIEELVTHAK